MKLYPDFVIQIKGESHQDINLCYQCKKCTSGCPIAYTMDYTPAQIIHAIRLGLKELVLNSKTIWLCASCETCTTRCPQEIDLVKVMDVCKSLAICLRIKPKIKEVPIFYKLVLTNIRFLGRMYELGLIGALKLCTGNFMQDVNLGITMFKKGKLKLLPSFTFKGALTAMNIFNKAKKVK
ncbi:TPA: heterodisulfide reductase subunit C [bacterium]|nr:heterodisulfide reductase subunit C [bacterium]